MKCNQCNTEFEGNFCPKCAAPAGSHCCNACGTVYSGAGNYCPKCGLQANTKAAWFRLKGRLLGFRSNKGWKKVLSSLYLLCFILPLSLTVIFEKKFENLSWYDFMISKISSLILLSLFIAPYFFLSNNTLRKNLPLFKKKKAGSSFLGMIIVWIILLVGMNSVDSFHSREFLADAENHAYVEISRKEALCGETGSIDYECSYCGTTYSEPLEALEHNWVEVSRIDPTVNQEGKLERKCFSCGTVETEILTKLPKSDAESSIEEPESSDFVEESEVTNKPNTETNVELSKKEYISLCEEGEYNSIARMPDDYKGKNIFFKGVVLDVTEGWFDEYTFLISTSKDEYGLNDNLVYVTYKLPDGSPKILEDDEVIFYGECKGDRSYMTILGSQNTLPYVDAKYIDILNQD